MKIELKPIVDQLTEAINLEKGYKVSAMIDEDNDNKLMGWMIVKVLDDGTLLPQSTLKFDTIKELINNIKELNNNRILFENLIKDNKRKEISFFEDKLRLANVNKFEL